MTLFIYESRVFHKLSISEWIEDHQHTTVDIQVLGFIYFNFEGKR